jgi:formylglycine-generating enzyme required for sulfatase activity
VGQPPAPAESVTPTFVSEHHRPEAPTAPGPGEVPKPWSLPRRRRWLALTGLAVGVISVAFLFSLSLDVRLSVGKKEEPPRAHAPGAGKEEEPPHAKAPLVVQPTPPVLPDKAQKESPPENPPKRVEPEPARVPKEKLVAPRPAEPRPEVPPPSAAEPAKEIANSIGMKLVRIPPGKFLMGSPQEEEGRYDNEERHEVEITKAFYLGKYEVTVGQFRAFVQATGYQTEAEKDEKSGGGYDEEKKEFPYNKKYAWQDPGFAQTDDHPVVNVSWNDAKEFCDWLSKKEDQQYRLATEAQWEYSCRAKTKTRFYCGDDDGSLERAANIADKSLKAKWNYSNLTNQAFKKLITDWFDKVSWDDGYPFTAPVGKFQQNAFGLHDMHGNVWEWCQDWYDKDYYKNSPRVDPEGPSAGSFRVIRGGSFGDPPRGCRAARRFRYEPAYRLFTLGFRVVRVR